MSHRGKRWWHLCFVLTAVLCAGLVNVSANAGLMPFGRAHRAATAALASPAPTNPLDPLTADEVATTFQVIAASPNFPPGALFPIVKLKEPPKSEVLAWSPGQPFRREAFANVYNNAKNQLFEVVVDVGGAPGGRAGDQFERVRAAGLSARSRYALAIGDAQPRHQPQ